MKKKRKHEKPKRSPERFPDLKVLNSLLWWEMKCWGPLIQSSPYSGRFQYTRWMSLIENVAQ